MASYQADIQIGVKGKASLNQLEKQLTRVNTAVKQLNKALTLKTRAQTIKLNTKGAMSAVRDLENRINRLGRTIDVRLRTTEERRERTSSSRSGGGGAGAVLAISPQAAKQTVAAQKQVTQAYEIQTREAKGLLALEQRRDALGEERIAQKKELVDLIEKQKRLEKEINTVENSATEQAKTANRNRIFGGRTSKAGNPLSPKQAFRAQEAQLRGVINRVRDLGSQIQKTERRYENLSKTSARYYGAERRRVMQATDALERYGRKQEQIQKAQKRRTSIRRGALVGGGAALTQIPGLGGIATGALGGASVAGPAGAAAGALAAALAEATAALAAFGGESAKFFNALQLSRKALANTVETTEEYKTALEGIRGVSQDFLVPIDEATSQFTKLNAAARASGFTVEEVTEVYRGLAAANTALGGNSERLQGILLATQQVFSKGKVQAEELRGQIGERLAGAFAKFAKAAGLSTSELDKALEKGEVSLEDFVKFSRSLLDEYEEDAKRLAKEPENSAERLERAMDNLKEALGPITRQIINLFNEMATAIVNSVATAIAWINKAQMAGAKGKVRAADRNVKQTQQRINEIDTTPGRRGNQFGQVSDSEYRNLEQQLELQIKQRAQARQELKDLVDVITPSGNPPEVKLPPAVSDPKSSGSGSSKSERESQLPALQRELALKQQLAAIDEKIIAANKAKDSDLVIRLEGQQRLAQIAKSRLDILAEEIPLDEKKTKLAINELKAKKAMRDTDEQLRQAAQGRQDSIDASIRSLELDAKLAGERNEYARDLLQIEADIVEMRKSGEGFDEQQLAAYKRAALGAAAAREEQRKYNEVLGQVQGPVNALVGGLKEVVAGTKSAEEAFVDFLNTIADQLIQTAATMIAQYIALGIARAFAFGGTPGASAGTGVVGGVGGAVGGVPVKFASGGYVTSPTPALIGEGGEPEYVIPESKMASSLIKYSAGVRGDAVTSSSASSGEGSFAPASDQPMSINISGGVTQIGGDEFIRKDQLPAIIDQSAKAGETRALRQLRMSQSTRQRVGV